VSASGKSLPNDRTPGTVDESDFIYWRAHFGESLGSGAGAAQGSAQSVPEPDACWLALEMVLGALRCVRVL
jgi:hypothetical protein